MENEPRVLHLASASTTQQVKSESVVNARVAAARIIKRWLATGDFLDRQLEDLAINNRAFAMELIYGVGRWKRLLEWAIESCVCKMPKRGIKSFLLVGAYEVLLMTDIEIYASVNEIVESVKKMYSKAETGFTNAIMRKLVVEKPNIMKMVEKQPMGVRTSHPDILIHRWKKQFGEKNVLSLCEWNNSRPKVVVKANLLKNRAKEFSAMLSKHHIKIADALNADEGWFVLEHGARVTELPGYKTGAFSVLDPAAKIAVDLLNPQPEEHVLDACAPPGGKTFLIAEQMRKHGYLKAVELHQDRFVRLRKNLDRLEYDCFVEALLGDITKIELNKDDGFHRILLDVPCSNTGVIRRRPDVRWGFSKHRLDKLVLTQFNILNSGLKALKPGGSLVYSTCSLECEENDCLVRRCLKDRPEFDLCEEKMIFPPHASTDGGYAALIRRKT